MQLLGFGLAISSQFACASVKPLPPGEALTRAQRRDAIQRAVVWMPTDVSAVDFKKGPAGETDFPSNEWVTCDYSEKDMSGASPKFTCVIPPDKTIKVKYGATNAEVFGEVLSTRLFAALGFPADTMFPVRVRCRGCSADPAHDPAKNAGTHEFDPAAIEKKLPGRPMETHVDSGWDWAELDDIGPNAPLDARTHRDALKLLAAFVQHGDSRPANQRLLCPEGQEHGELGCQEPIMMVHDVRLTFGKATRLRKSASAVDVDKWASVPVWRNRGKCVAALKNSFFGRFHNPTISEGGRAFLAGLLNQLSDAQLRDLFETARVPKRRSKDGDGAQSASADIDEWVRVFKEKRAEISEARCPR